MKFRTTFYLFITVCVLGGLVYLMDYYSRLSQARNTSGHLVFGGEVDGVSAITVVRADEAAVERIIAALETLKWSDSIDVEQRRLRGLVLADYGLEHPAVEVTVSSDSGSLTLLVGDEAPLGRGVYVRSDSSDDVFVVSGGLVDALSVTVEMLRDRHIFHGHPEHTTRIEMSRTGCGFIQLARQGSGWVIQQPVAAPADAAEVQMLLDFLYGLKVKRFFWDARDDGAAAKDEAEIEMAVSARIESCGLAADEARVRVTLYAEGDSLGQELLVGKNVPDSQGDIFVKRGRNESVYIVDDDILSVCVCDVADLRDKRIFHAKESDIGSIVLQVGESRLKLQRNAGKQNMWSIEEPVKWAADASETDVLLKKIMNLSAGKYLKQPLKQESGLEHPRCTITLAGQPEDSVGKGSAEAVESVFKGHELLVGSRYDNKSYFAKLKDSEEIFTLDAVFTDWLTDSNTVSPLHYCDRVMLTIVPGHVQRITVANADGEHSVERADGGKWSCVGDKSSKPESDTIEQLLKLIKEIRAIDIKEHAPESLSKYGLDLPVVTLTLKLEGEENVQKSILLGGEASSASRYAMVRGRDIVFTVPELLSDVLMRPLCVCRECSTNAVQTEGPGR